MSLTHFIRKSPIFQEFIRAIIPNKDNFCALSGKKPFSSEYQCLAPCIHDKPSVSGIAFDYLARFRVAQIVSDIYSKTVCENLAAQSGLKKLLGKIPDDLYRKFEEKYTTSILQVKEFINKKKSIECIIDHMIFFAKLEQVFRSGGILPMAGAESILTSETTIKDDLAALYTVMENNFIKNCVSSKSSVIFNPHFGKYSNLIGGADADIIIDNTLYDFKTSVNKGYSWKDCAQIVSYYFMHILNNSTENVSTCNIHYIALYQARYGETCVFDTGKFGDKLVFYLNDFKDFFYKLETNKDFFVECFNPKSGLSYNIDSTEIKEYRKINNLSQDKFAELLGINRKTLRFWETGQSSPSFENLQKLYNLIHPQ